MPSRGLVDDTVLFSPFSMDWYRNSFLCRKSTVQKSRNLLCPAHSDQRSIFNSQLQRLIDWTIKKESVFFIDERSWPAGLPGKKNGKARGGVFLLLSCQKHKGNLKQRCQLLYLLHHTSKTSACSCSGRQVQYVLVIIAFLVFLNKKCANRIISFSRWWCTFKWHPMSWVRGLASSLTVLEKHSREKKEEEDLLENFWYRLWAGRGRIKSVVRQRQCSLWSENVSQWRHLRC